MTDTEIYNCVYCEKQYKHRGWLANHIKKKHEDAHQLDEDMTVLRDNALDLSTKEAALDLSENPFWENDVPILPPGPTSTPHMSAPVPLCPKAGSYIKERGKTLPASFLATLLPAPDFLDALDHSLQQDVTANDLLQRFEEEIRCLKCEVCGLTFLGSRNLRDHTKKAHHQYLQPTSPDPALPSLGDYLARLESKIEHCTNLITEQSTVIEKLVKLQERKIKSTNPTLSANKDIPIIEIEDDPRNYLECEYCAFKTDNKSQLNLHKSGKHSKETSLIVCPMCDYKSNSEPEVTKHVQDQHKEDEPMNQLTCEYCAFKTDSKSQLNLHKSGKHRKETTLIVCPMCDYKSTSEPEVTKHVQDQHKETFSCSKCNKTFENETSLRTHITGDHIQCNQCSQDFTTKTDHKKHMAEQHAQQTTDWSLLVGDSHIKAIKSRQIEKVLKGNRLRNPAASSPRAGSTYNTSRFWPGARYPDSNLEEKIPALLKERPYKSMIVLTPSNNIKNIESLDRHEQNELAVQTALETVAIVEKALKETPTLEKVIIVETPPRADSERLSELSEFCNFTLKSRVEKSEHHDQITIANLDTIYEYKVEHIFGHPSSQLYDGIHMKGKYGKQAYTDCILAAVESAGLRRPRRYTAIDSNRNTTSHTNNRSSTNTSYTIPTSNRFETLSN